MSQVYRVLRRPFSKNPFDGEGSYRFGDRWSSPGTRIAYASGHQSLAMMEYLVHVDPDDPPDDLILATAEVPDSLSRERFSIRRLRRDWRQSPPPPALSEIGDAFIRERRTAVLLVPSVLVPKEFNWLLNPSHPDFRRIRLTAAEPFSYDPRLLR